MTDVPARTPLGASTPNSMYYLDVDTASSDTNPTWVAVQGITEFQPANAPNLEDDSDFDSGGDQSQTKTAQQRSLVMKVGRKTLTADPAAYDPGQEFLRSKDSKIGGANAVHIRYYEMSEGGPRLEAYEGWAAVSWSPDGGAMTALNIVSVTLTGQGAWKEIAHPAGGGALAPTVTSLDPASGSAAGGELVMIHGENLSGATAVAFGADPAADFSVVGPTQIAAVTPAGVAGDVDVTVTTPAGTSGTGAGSTFTYA